MPRESTDWFAVLSLFVAGLAASMHFAKVAPVMDAIGADLHLGFVATGFAVSMVGMVGVLFAITTGAVVGAVGLQRAVLAALWGGAAIAALLAISFNGPMFLLLRFAEGFSHLLIVISAPALMSAFASDKDRPIALALWGCFFGVGFAITSAVAPLIVPAAGWRGLMVGHAAFLAVSAGAVTLALRSAPAAGSRSTLPGLTALLTAHANVYRSGSPLLLALTFCCYTILFLAVLTFLGRFLIGTQGWNDAQTGSFLAFASLITLVFTLGAGALSRWGVSLFAGLTGAFMVVGLSAVAVFTMGLSNAGVTAFALLMMASFGLLPGFVFANVPLVAPTPVLAALTYGAIAQFGNVGTFLGTPIFAASYDRFGWTGIGAFIAGASLAGIAMAATLKGAMKLQGAR